jgi:uncharacterized protein involved in exopolysaccharide biosynthesis
MSQNNSEIDLRDTLRVIIAKWYWIVAVVLVAMIIAFLVSYFFPKEYWASAYVALTKPDVVFLFDPRITTLVETPTGEGIRDLALGDDVLMEVLRSSESADFIVNVKTIDDFREMVVASLSDTVLKLIVKAPDPTQAAGLANIWAEEVSSRLNEIYAPTSRSQGIFETQAEDALLQWSVSQQAFIEFQATNPEIILEQRLEAQKRVLFSFLDAQRSLSLVLQDAQAVKERLEAREGTLDSNLRDDLTTIFLAIRSLSTTMPEIPTLDLQLVIDENRTLDETVEEQAKYLEELITSLNGQIFVLEESTEKQETVIIDLQTQLTEAQEEKARLEQERDLAKETYQTLARKAEETRLSTYDQDVVARVASRAVTPSKAKRPILLFNTMLAGLTGLILGIAGILFREYWIDPEAEARSGVDTM